LAYRRAGGKHPGDCSPGRPGRGSKPLSVSGSIRLRAFLDGREAFFIPSPRACSWGVGRFTISRGILRRNAFTVPSGCVVSAPWLALSPGGFPPTPMASGEGTFLSGRLLPTRTTVSCPPPPGGRTHEGLLDNGSLDLGAADSRPGQTTRRVSRCPDYGRVGSEVGS